MDAEQWIVMERLGRIEHKVDQISDKLDKEPPDAPSPLKDPWLILAAAGLYLLLPQEKAAMIAGLLGVK